MTKLSRRPACRASFLHGLLIALAFSPGLIHAEEFRILPAESYVQFKISHLGIGMVTGRFETVTGTVRMNPADLSVSGLDVSIATRSLNTGIGARDEALLGDGYLRERSFPEINFRSTGLVPASSGFAVTGRLTLRGASKTITLVSDPPQLRSGPGGESQAVLTGRCQVARRDIGLQFENSRDADASWLGDSVEIGFVLAVQEVAQ